VQYGYAPQPYVPSRPTNGMAIASLICSVAGWILLPLIGGIAGVILGHIATSQIRRTKEDGRGLAVAGLVVGYIQIGVILIVVALWILLIVGLAGAASTTS